LSYVILEEHSIPNALAKKFLEEYVEMLSRMGFNVDESPTLRKVLEYLDRVVNCPEDSAEELFEKLKMHGLKEETAAMILNVVPTSVDELRTLLFLESRVPEENVLDEIVKLVSERCTSSSIRS